MRFLFLLPLFLPAIHLQAQSSLETSSNPAPWRSTLYPAYWKPGFKDANGHFLHDFSYAGYHYGDANIPEIEGPVFDVTTPPYLADKTGRNDSTAAIQSALDAAEKAGGGIIFLPAGTYRVMPVGTDKQTLWIRGDHIVLRGEGADKTFLFNDSYDMRGKVVIKVEASEKADWHAEGNGIPFSPATQDVENQSREVKVQDTTPFAKGDLVILRGDLTQRFIDSVEMTGKWQPAGAGSQNRTLMFCRRIVDIDSAGKRLIFDVPVRYPVLVADNARVVKIPGHMISEVGLENFAMGMKQCPGEGLGEEDWSKPGTIGSLVHAAGGIRLEAAENCWISEVKTYAAPGNDPNVHVLSCMLALSRSRLVTVQKCDFKFSQYKGGGGNGYLYTTQGQENLITHCVAEGGRHNYDFGTMRSSGNVITHCLAKDGQLGSDFHMFLSMSNLLDNVTCEGDFLEARYIRPWGGNPMHGVTTTQTVYWNNNGQRYSKEKAVLIWSQQVGDGYVIGTRGPASKVDSDDFVEGVGKGEDLLPASLYEDQKMRRLNK